MTTESKFEFPFAGAGDATYFEWASVYVWFTSAPAPAKRKKIARRIPAPLRDSVSWDGRVLRLSGGQMVHVSIAETYDADPGDQDDAGHFFFAATSRVTRFNEDIEEWLRFAHAQHAIELAFRAEDAESGGTLLSDWHYWSMEQVENLLPSLRAAGTSAYVLSNLGDMMKGAEKKKRKRKPTKKKAAKKKPAKKKPAKKKPAKKKPAKKNAAKKNAAKKKPAKKKPAKKKASKRRRR